MDERCQKVKLALPSSESSQYVRELQNFIGTITQQTAASGLGRSLRPDIWSVPLLYSRFFRDRTGFVGAGKVALCKAVQWTGATADLGEFVGLPIATKRGQPDLVMHMWMQDFTAVWWCDISCLKLKAGFCELVHGSTSVGRVPFTLVSLVQKHRAPYHLGRSFPSFWSAQWHLCRGSSPPASWAQTHCLPKSHRAALPAGE